MKKEILILAAVLAMSFTAIQENKKNIAAVDQVQGLYIFMHSKPTGETVFLGAVKVSITLTGNIHEVINKLIKKAQKEYPSAEAIIINDAFDKADVVSFK